MVKFKDFSRPLSVFQVLFKANFQGLFKTVLYIQVLFKPARTLPSVSNILDPDLFIKIYQLMTKVVSDR